MSSLYLPKFCIIPLAARLDTDLPDSAKIYLGELNALANKFGYCWASDDELAQMKGVSERTIQNWHSVLEKKGFIKRDTWKEHYTDPQKAGVLIKSKRKIFIVEEPNSNNVAEAQKSAPHCEAQKSAPHCEAQKSAGISKEPLNHESIKNKNPLPPKGAAAPAAKVKDISFSSEVKETAKAIIDAVVEEKPDYKRPTNTHAVEISVDQMIRIDKRSPDKILTVMRSALSDDFWRPHFMKANPAAYLRPRFDQIETKMNRPFVGGNKVDRRLKNADGSAVSMPHIDNLF